MRSSLAFSDRMKTIRVLSFQSEEVVDLLLKEGYYSADPVLSRERRDYRLDVEQLGGKQPVWGFISTNPEGFQPIDFLDSFLLEKFRCEMSLGMDGLQDFVLLELDIPRQLVKVGLTHNACDYAVVFPGIKLDWLISVAKVAAVEHDIFDYRYTVVDKVFRGESILLDNVVDTIYKINSDIGINFKTIVYPDNQCASISTIDYQVIYSLNVDKRRLNVEVEFTLPEPQLGNLLRELESFFRTKGAVSFDCTISRPW